MYQCYDGYYDCTPMPCGTFDRTFSTDALTYWERSFSSVCAVCSSSAACRKQARDKLRGITTPFISALSDGLRGCFQSKTYGVVVQPGVLTGYGLQFQPRGMQISTPFLIFPVLWKLAGMRRYQVNA